MVSDKGRQDSRYFCLKTPEELTEPERRTIKTQFLP